MHLKTSLILNLNPMGKHKRQKTAYIPLPNTRFNELFNTSISCASVVIHLTRDPKSFNLLSLTQKKPFINDLIEIIGQVNPGTKCTAKGENYIYLKTRSEKSALLELENLEQPQYIMLIVNIITDGTRRV